MSSVVPPALRAYSMVAGYWSAFLYVAVIQFFYIWCHHVFPYSQQTLVHVGGSRFRPIPSRHFVILILCFIDSLTNILSPTLSNPWRCPWIQYIIVKLLLNVFVNAPYVDVWRSDRGRGWYSLVVTQPSVSYQLLCVQVYVFACKLLCLVFIIAGHLVNKVIIYQLTPQTLQVEVSSIMSHIPF